MPRPHVPRTLSTSKPQDLPLSDRSTCDAFVNFGFNPARSLCLELFTCSQRVLRLRSHRYKHSVSRSAPLRLKREIPNAHWLPHLHSTPPQPTPQDVCSRTDSACCGFQCDP